MTSALLLGTAAGCAIQESPYVSLGENLEEAGGEGGVWLGTGGGSESGGGAGRVDEPAGRGGEGAGGRGGEGAGGGGSHADAGTGGVASTGNTSGVGGQSGAGGGQAGTMQAPNAGSAGSTGGGGMNCPAIGCTPEFQRVYELEDTFDDTVELRAEICQNDLCLDAELSLTRSDFGPGAGLGTEVPDQEQREREQLPMMTFTVMGGLEGGIELRLSWRLWDPGDAANGDMYRVVVETLDGEFVAGETEAVNYELVEIAACTSCLVALPAPEN